MLKSKYNFIVINYQKPYAERITEQFNIPIELPGQEEVDAVII
jgi:hypothetical protein